MAVHYVVQIFSLKNRLLDCDSVGIGSECSSLEVTKFNFVLVRLGQLHFLLYLVHEAEDLSLQNFSKTPHNTTNYRMTY
jgi:hypothetical protein